MDRKKEEQEVKNIRSINTVFVWEAHLDKSLHGTLKSVFSSFQHWLAATIVLVMFCMTNMNV